MSNQFKINASFNFGDIIHCLELDENNNYVRIVTERVKTISFDDSGVIKYNNHKEWNCFSDFEKAYKIFIGEEI